MRTRFPLRTGVPLVLAALLALGLWQGAVLLVAPPPYILPAPAETLSALLEYRRSLLWHTAVTATEIVLGLLAGGLAGVAVALALSLSAATRLVFLPVIVASQAVPVFALAPLLTLWFGYGLAPKILMASLITFFPVAAAFSDGLRATDRGLADLATVMTGRRNSWRILLFLRLPAALPGLCSGLRIAAAVAPIGAVIGEWVGAADGLGMAMLRANAESKTDLMFACLVLLMLLGVGFHTLTDRLLRFLVPWSPAGAHQPDRKTRP